MHLQEALDMRGRLTIQQRSVTHELIAEIKANNNIVLTGRDLVAKMFINETIAPVSHVAVGTGAAAVNPDGDTQLQAELFRKAIIPIDPTQHLVTTANGRKQVTITAELDFNEANGALTEAGLFNAASSGVMYNRVVFPPINKTADFKLTLIWQITF